MYRLIIIALLAVLVTSCATTNYENDANESSASYGPESIEDPAMSVDLTTYLKRFSGIYVSGQGASASIYIRGINSLTGNNEPLILLDGMQIGSYSDLFGMITSANVKRIEVLKNPEDIGVYGVRGANGVLRITTRRS